MNRSDLVFAMAYQAGFVKTNLFYSVLCLFLASTQIASTCRTLPYPQWIVQDQNNTSTIDSTVNDSPFAEDEEINISPIAEDEEVNIEVSDIYFPKNSRANNMTIED